MSTKKVAYVLLFLVTTLSAFQVPNDVRQSQSGIITGVEAYPNRLSLTLLESKPNDARDVADISKNNDEKEQERRTDYERRRRLWEERYGSVEALKRSFGDTSRWGDLDPESTRLLYHTLLPRSLLGLHEAGLMRPDELAPLAYQARVAAKEYARYRSRVPGRIVAMAYDGYRSFRRYGTFRTKGVSWEQLWDKYEAQIVEECVDELSEGNEIDKDALTARIYLRILERSCATNQAFDRMFLKSSDNNEEFEDLDDIAKQLDHDVREILLHPKGAKKMRKYKIKAEKRQEKVARKVASKQRAQEEKAEKKRLRQEQKREKAAEKARARAEKEERKRLKAERKKAERQS